MTKTRLCTICMKVKAITYPGVDICDDCETKIAKQEAEDPHGLDGLAEDIEERDKVDSFESVVASKDEEILRLRVALKRAARVFRTYARAHEAKETPDGDNKAKANADHAAACERALRGIE